MPWPPWINSMLITWKAILWLISHHTRLLPWYHDWETCLWHSRLSGDHTVIPVATIPFWVMACRASVSEIVLIRGWMATSSHPSWCLGSCRESTSVVRCLSRWAGAGRGGAAGRDRRAVAGGFLIGSLLAEVLLLFLSGLEMLITWHFIGGIFVSAQLQNKNVTTAFWHKDVS